jgi:P-type E1-E2 ATPase
VGCVILVRPGDAVALDGVVLAGSSSMDEAMLTGEVAPVAVGPGYKVMAGTINSGAGVLQVRNPWHPGRHKVTQPCRNNLELFFWIILPICLLWHCVA